MPNRRALDRALAAWRRRELLFPARLRRMMPDAMDSATGAFPPPTYALRMTEPISIRCLLCGLISYHPRDVSERYCGHCHIFHEDQ